MQRDKLYNANSMILSFEIDTSGALSSSELTSQKVQDRPAAKRRPSADYLPQKRSNRGVAESVTIPAGYKHHIDDLYFSLPSTIRGR